MAKRKLGFGIIGCGMISEFHINSIKELDEKAKIIGITDTVHDAAIRISERHGLDIFDSVEDMLADKKVDVVCICTPSGYHAETIIKASEAKKHIIVEKPMAITKEQLDEVEKYCAKNKTVLSVISQIRFARDIKRAKRAIESGEMGRIVTADMYMKYNRSQEYYDSGAWRGTMRLDGGGALMNQGIHGVDLLQYLAGPVKSVFAYSGTLSRKIEVEDTLSAVMEFESGAFGVIQATTSVYPGYPRRLEINGDLGSLVIEETVLTKMDIFGSKTTDLTHQSNVASGSSTASSIATDYHTLQISDVIDAIREKRKPFVDIIEGRKAVDIILAIYKSSREGRKVYIEELNDRPNKYFC
ncbi:Gfo/Idh/MocA family oxidoreductase [Eubacteriales bacterium OttesenSCG-928-G02]|nr:Gfo/Idh/MocA family oxidoreductase [Eubacteriales bacterium OttesenSCG-928-G02]